MALVKVEGLRHGALRLSTRPPEDLVGRDVAVVGYPAFDSRNPFDVQNTVFDGVYGIKRLQPGKMKAVAAVSSYLHSVDASTHDSSTLGGNSGSCVIDLESGEVLGLHFGGRYAEANFCVPAGALATDGRVIDAGVSFADPVSRVATEWDSYWRDTEASASSDADAADATTKPQAKSGVTQGSGEVRITVPLEIIIRLGSAQLAVTLQAGAAAAEEEERVREPIHDDDYSTRQGYDPDFLGVTVPLPTPRNPDELVRVEDGGHLLHYHHFSLAMHRTRRLALFTAANVDASDDAKTPDNRPRKDYSRNGLADFGPNDREKWFSDPRILATEQLPDKLGLTANSRTSGRF